MDPRTPVVVAARRTPVATAGKGLAGVEVAHLAAPVLASLAGDLAAGVPAAVLPRIGEVLLGNCCGPGGDVARVATLAAGLGTEVPGVTVDRQCGSGLEAIRLGAALVGSGAVEVVLAGGAESASTAPWRLTRPRGVFDVPRGYLRAPFVPAGFEDPEMGEAAETVARRCGISRERQDTYAARSHARTLAAAQAGRFAAELVPVAGAVDDDRPRRGLTEATLRRFRPAFRTGGTVTAGNSCGINDGAAAVALVSERVRAAAGLPGLRVLATAATGVDPAAPGLGPVPAVREVLDRAGLSIAEVAVLEITEAFAAQVLACTDALGLDALGADADRVCPQGGAIALGHPWGASGALLMVRLFAALVRCRGVTGRDTHRDNDAGRYGVAGRDNDDNDDNGRYGVATCAVGGGQGLAVLVERVNSPVVSE